MSTKGIIFSAPMVRALLDDRKTQTRRLLSTARVFGTPCKPAFTIKGETLSRALQGADRWRHLGGDGWFWEADAFDYQSPAERTGWMAHISYAPGDRLYVREACRAEEISRPPRTRYATQKERRLLGRTSVIECNEDDGRDGVRFMADGAFIGIEPTMIAGELWSDMYHYRGRGKAGIGNLVPSIHMPRWASRLWLTVTDVRVERLQSISAADCIEEGIDADAIAHFGCPIKAYAALWDSLHGGESDHSWAANPWVVALTFTVHRGNIDREGGAA